MGKRNPSRELGQALITVMLILLILFSGMMVGGFAKNDPKPNSNSAIVIPVIPSPDLARQNLQLKTFGFITPTPTTIPTTPPGPICGTDDGVCHPQADEGAVCCLNLVFNCSGGKCVPSPGGGPDVCDDLFGLGIGDAVCQQACGSSDGFTCFGKPVIYLYPERPMFVDVSVQTAGRIVVSDPPYPPQGWKNIKAIPDGTLVYEGNEYKELFYESEVPNIPAPSNGIIIPSSQLKDSLASILYQLGLNRFEGDEFLDFWIPRLKALKSNYILFSLIDKNTKELNDRVIVSPAPDIRIEFIAYFKPIDFPIVTERLELPPRPERYGFTMVEWGGTIGALNSTAALQ